MTLPVRILVRTSTDWRAMGREAFGAQRDRALPVAWIRYTDRRDVMDLWDGVFSVDFFSYRAAVRDIAAAALPLAGADLVSVGLDHLEPFDSFDAWWRSRDDEILVTVDDDDLFTPGMGALRDEFGAGVDVVLWPQAFLGFPNDETTLKFNWAPMPHVLQNNCAVRKSFIKEHFRPGVARQVLAHHPIANERFADALAIEQGATGLKRFRVLDHPSVKFISPCFGLYNQHVGSISFLMQVLGRDDPTGYLKSLDFRLPSPIPVFANPFRPALEALEDLWLSMRSGG